MQEEEYTFVTIDSEDNLFSDAVVVDMDTDNDLEGIVIIDEGADTDFISLSDETIMLSDSDMIDLSLGDIGDADISIMI